MPCAERHLCVNPGSDSRGEWSSSHQIPADAPTVIQRRLSYRENTFYTQQPIPDIHFYCQWKGSVVKCRLWFQPQQWGKCDYYHPTGCLSSRSLIPVIIPANAASQGMNFPVMEKQHHAKRDNDIMHEIYPSILLINKPNWSDTPGCLPLVIERLSDGFYVLHNTKWHV